MFTRILIGIAVSAFGILITTNTGIAIEAIGRVDWAERNLGPGGSRTLFKLVGLGITIIGFIIITNLFDRLIGSTITGLLVR